VSSFKALIFFGIIGSFWLTPVDAAERREALMLHGAACSNDRDIIREALLQLSGVHGVDAQSIPGYLLIDVVAGEISSEELTAAVNRLSAGEGNCRAEPMQSCISTDGHHQTEHAASIRPAPK
jgi:hypothetical protein